MPRTITALFDLSDNIIKALDKKVAVTLLSNDFSKAFDKAFIKKLNYAFIGKTYVL